MFQLMLLALAKLGVVFSNCSGCTEMLRDIIIPRYYGDGQWTRPFMFDGVATMVVEFNHHINIYYCVKNTVGKVVDDHPGLGFKGEVFIYCDENYLITADDTDHGYSEMPTNEVHVLSALRLLTMK